MKTTLLAIFASGVVFSFGQELTDPPLGGLRREEQKQFEAGRELFYATWKPAGDGKHDGLGPFFHADSCASCHPNAGRSPLPKSGELASVGLLFRVGTADSELLDDYGPQLAPNAIDGIKPEGQIAITWEETSVKYADGAAVKLRRPKFTPEKWNYGAPPADLRLSPRQAPALYGGGLLEAVSDETLRSLADPQDTNKDGISGRLNLEETWEGYHATALVPGRFGWKAWMPTLLRQTCAALGEDMGITNIFNPYDSVPEQFEAVEHLPHGGAGQGKEIHSRDLGNLVAYLRFLAPPKPLQLPPEKEARGRELFAALNCAACHLPEMKTGKHKTGSLSEQVIYPFTDLLLHDMGPDLADGRTEAEAGASEWRTAPLWGLNIALAAGGQFLHDGRARNLEEAILWHDGEAENAKKAFMSKSMDDRKALLDWLAAR